jgi:hypothetical protein
MSPAGISVHLGGDCSVSQFTLIDLLVGRSSQVTAR